MEAALRSQPAALDLARPDRLGKNAAGRALTAIRRLAADIPALWHAETTTAADRQAIVRQLVDQVVVTVHGQSEKVDVQLHWVGGHATAVMLIRPVAKLEQLSYYPQLLARVAALHAQGYTPKAIAAQLNAEGWRPPRRRETFNAAMVYTLLLSQGLSGRRRGFSDTVDSRGANEWTVPELSRQLGIPHPTLFSWLKRGWLQGRQVMQAAHCVWLIQADEAELAKLRERRSRSHS